MAGNALRWSLVRFVGAVFWHTTTLIGLWVIYLWVFKPSEAGYIFNDRVERVSKCFGWKGLWQFLQGQEIRGPSPNGSEEDPGTRGAAAEIATVYWDISYGVLGVCARVSKLLTRWVVSVLG